MARKTLSSLSVNLKPYIEEVMRKASINKASKIYEHGISLGQTANLLGISQWELSEYTGQTSIADTNYNNTINTKKRAQMAMEFFG
jgi:predicted transcriptional regulator